MGSKEEALVCYAKLKEQLGCPPSSRQFYKVYKKRKLASLFEGGKAYSQLQQLAGDEPNRFSLPKSSLPEILLQWGRLARETLRKYERLPIQDDWTFSTMKPSVVGIEKSHRLKWSEIPQRFLDKHHNDEEWQDVVAVIPVESVLPECGKSPNREECFVYLMEDLRNGNHKIGISKTPGTRERTLQSEQPRTRLVAVKKYVNRKMALAMEKALHELYGHKRKRGEWFDLSAEDLGELRLTLNDPTD